MHVDTSKAETKLNKFPKVTQTAITDGPQKVAETTSTEGNSQLTEDADDHDDHDDHDHRLAQGQLEHQPR